MRFTTILLPVAVLTAAPLAAQDSPPFDQAILEACVAETGAEADCIGSWADHCMSTSPEGGSTIGNALCLRSELDYWDGRLNAVYQALMEVYAVPAEDASRPSDAEALRHMQRNWIAYRDAACDFEELQWWGGTAAGPAYLACLMDLTATQALRLETYHWQG